MHLILFKKIPTEGGVFRAEVVEVIRGERDLRQRRRLQREWLCWGSLLAGNDGLGNRTFFHSIERSPGYAIKRKQQAHLGDLRNGGNRPPADDSVEQDRCSCRIEIPEIVVK